MPQRRAKVIPRTAAEARRIETVTVEGAYGRGPDKVERVRDPLLMLHGQRAIDDMQRQAGNRYVRSHEIISSGLQCALGRDSAARAPGPRTPTPATLRAADDLAKAREALGWLDSAVLRSVLLEGLSLERAAEHLLPGPAASRHRDHIGHRLRMALLVLVDIRYPSASQHRHVLLWRAPDAVPSGGTAGEIQHSELAGKTAHVRLVRGRVEIR